jgi:hypothetical protein
VTIVNASTGSPISGVQLSHMPAKAIRDPFRGAIFYGSFLYLAVAIGARA